VASPLSFPFSIPLPFIFQEAKESIDEEDPRLTSSNGAASLKIPNIFSTIMWCFMLTKNKPSISSSNTSERYKVNLQLERRSLRVNEEGREGEVTSST